MTSCREIIVLALGKIGVAGGSTPPRQSDLELGLATLQSKYRELIDSGALGRSRSVIVTATDYTARENDRIKRLKGASGNITLPSTVADELVVNDYGTRGTDYQNTVLGYQRPPRNGAYVIVNDDESNLHFAAIYDGYRDCWMTIEDLTLDDRTEYRDAQGVVVETRTSDAPLSANKNGLAAVLALQLADHFGAVPSQLTVRDAQRFEQALVTHFGEGRTVTPICPF